jgi:hypothetical protein
MELRDKDWDRGLEQGLPDSRLTGPDRENKTVYYARMNWEKIFCANCGDPGGIVTAGFSPHVFYICPKCVHVAGSPPGCVEVGTVNGR